MLKSIDSFKSINFYCKNRDNLYFVQCYTILNKKNLNCSNKQEIINKFKPTCVIYKHKVRKGYFHELKNLFIFGNKIVHVKYIKYPELFKTFVEYYKKFHNITVSFDLIPVFIELYNKNESILKYAQHIYLNKLRLTMQINDVSFKNYDVYNKLIQKAKKEKTSVITIDNNIRFDIQFEGYNKIRQIDLYIDLGIWHMYKLLNFVY